MNSVEAAHAPVSWHRIRKATHIACFLIFLILPFFDLMRFDIPHERFYFLGRELWISEFAIIFFALMFLLFLVATAALLYGRVYCGYFCPQMIFSEASLALEQRISSTFTRYATKWSRPQRKRATRIVTLLALVPVSVVLAFIFISYFVEPRDLLSRLLKFDVTTAGGIAGAATTILVFLDFAFLRLRFCTSVCPYGYLQGFLSDDKTLHVCYRDDPKECVECRKCIKVCHMGIDIRTSSRQIECVHCGECIDACADIMGREGKQGLIHYTWGAEGAPAAGKMPWYRKAGLLDAKRVVILLVLFGYACGLGVTVAMRSPVLVRLVPDRTTLYALAPDGAVTNHFRMTVANRGTTEASLTIETRGLDRARISEGGARVTVPPGASVTHEFDVAVADPAPGVNPIRFLARWEPGSGEREYPMTFIAPEGGKRP